jgi:REP element-mobilizing transposase RayT
MWNDTDIPLAYFITFRCYGTWLHGDERGSIDRFHNRYKSPTIPPNKRWQDRNVRSLNQEPVILTAERRESVEAAIRETCTQRKWLLRGVNVRTNHVHIVVSTGYVPAVRALNALKANATREMRKTGRWNQASSPWADGGRKRMLWNERSIERAVDYVVIGQGGPLPDFDR